MAKEDQALVLETSLQSFFYDKLSNLNKKLTPPLRNETIYYSSFVLDKLSESNQYFEVSEGRVRDKILGLKMLEAQQKNRNVQKREFKEIGDTALLLCGFFSESLNKKIIDSKYYQDIGIMAYQQLDKIIPQHFEVPSFYQLLARSFETLSNMISILAKEGLEQREKMNGQIIFISMDKKIKAS